MEYMYRLQKKLFKKSYHEIVEGYKRGHGSLNFYFLTSSIQASRGDCIVANLLHTEKQFSVRGRSTTMNMDTTQYSLKVSTKWQTCYATILVWTTNLQNDDGEPSSNTEVTYQVIIAIVQVAICGIIIYQMCANHFFTLCNKVIVTSLVTSELMVIPVQVKYFHKNNIPFTFCARDVMVLMC